MSPGRRDRASRAHDMGPLEKAGFTREGILRRAQSLGGAYDDLVSYSILREDL